MLAHLKSIPETREREANEKSIPIIRERKSEAFILGNGREWEFPLTPGIESPNDWHEHCTHVLFWTQSIDRETSFRPLFGL